MVIDDIRDNSRSVLAAHGLSVPASLPTLDIVNLRSSGDILDRPFCLNAVSAASYGFEAAKALSWLRQEQLDEQLTQPERSFLEEGQGDRDVFKVQVEGMWALAWAVNIVPEINFLARLQLKLCETSSEPENGRKPCANDGPSSIVC